MHLRLLYYDVMDESDKQTLYSLRTHTAPNKQLTYAILYRTAEFGTPSVAVTIAPIKIKVAWGYMGTPHAREQYRITGRPLELKSPAWGTIQGAPDRLEKPSWTPRRFLYGGRRFVWKQDGKSE